MAMQNTGSAVTGKPTVEFVARVNEIVVEAGGRTDIDTFIYQYTIPVTRFGPLYVSVHEPLGRSAVGSIMCRFEYPELAVGNVGGQSLNPYSGKWNFHFHQGATVDEAVAEFRHALERLLVPGMQGRMADMAACGLN